MCLISIELLEERCEYLGGTHAAVIRHRVKKHIAANQVITFSHTQT